MSILTPIFKCSCWCYDTGNVLLLHRHGLLVQIDFEFFQNLGTSSWRGPFCCIDRAVQIAFFLAGRRTTFFTSRSFFFIALTARCIFAVFQVCISWCQFKKVNKSNQTFQFASYRYFYKIPCPYVNKSKDILPVIKINW